MIIFCNLDFGIYYLNYQWPLVFIWIYSPLEYYSNTKTIIGFIKVEYFLMVIL